MPTTPFLNMFGRSPIRPLEEHMSKVNECVKLLLPFFEAVIQQDWLKVDAIQKEISKFENEADKLKRSIRLHLPTGLFMPVSRTDLLALLNVQDRLANKAKDIAGVALGRKMIIPEVIANLFMEFLKKCVDASHQADVAIHELDELLETSFSGSEIKVVEGMIDKLSQIERETDQQQVQLRQSLLQEEDKYPPVHIVFLYKIIKWTGDLADRAQDIGDGLQILLAK